MRWPWIAPSRQPAKAWRWNVLLRGDDRLGGVVLEDQADSARPVVLALRPDQIEFLRDQPGKAEMVARARELTELLREAAAWLEVVGPEPEQIKRTSRYGRFIARVAHVLERIDTAQA